MILCFLILEDNLYKIDPLFFLGLLLLHFLIFVGVSVMVIYITWLNSFSNLFWFNFLWCSSSLLSPSLPTSYDSSFFKGILDWSFESSFFTSSSNCFCGTCSCWGSPGFFSLKGRGKRFWNNIFALFALINSGFAIKII